MWETIYGTALSFPEIGMSVKINLKVKRVNLHESFKFIFSKKMLFENNNLIGKVL